VSLPLTSSLSEQRKSLQKILPLSSFSSHLMKGSRRFDGKDPLTFSFSSTSSQGQPSVYSLENAFQCLRCAPGCESCVDSSPCIVSLNWVSNDLVLRRLRRNPWERCAINNAWHAMWTTLSEPLRYVKDHKRKIIADPRMKILSITNGVFLTLLIQVLRTILLILQCIIIACLPVVVLFTYKYKEIKVSDRTSSLSLVSPLTAVALIYQARARS